MNEYPLKRLTLADAVGQTLLGAVDIRSDVVRLLRFSGGIVALETHYESSSITDFADSEDILKPPAYSLSTAEKAELLAAGFVDEFWVAECGRIRAEQLASNEQRREESDRQHYERLKAKFDPPSCTS